MIYTAHWGIITIHSENNVDYNILLNKLTTGEATYTSDDTGLIVGTKYSAPNKYMLAAAKVIKKLIEQLTANQHYMKVLENERDSAYAELERLNVQINSNTKSTEQNKPNS